MKVLYVGTPDTYHRWREGKNPSHWLYGACEMEQDGHVVIWEREERGLLHDVNLLYKHRPDIVFIPNLNIRAHLLLLLLTMFKIIRIPIFAWLHHTPKGGKTTLLYRMALHGLKHCFFLSELTMQETIDGGYIKSQRCSVPGWGADMDFYAKVPIKCGRWFVSTGKEQRDFDTLIEAFRRTGAPLKIITCRSHAGNNFERLPESCKDIPNIDVIITDNSGEIYPMMLREMASAKALVCPLIHDKRTYCVGLSTIVDAEGLHKPLIITHNPYHSDTRMQQFNVVDTMDDWVKAIDSIGGEQHVMGDRSMRACYERMRSLIFDRCQ